MGNEQVILRQSTDPCQMAAACSVIDLFSRRQSPDIDRADGRDVAWH